MQELMMEEGGRGKKAEREEGKRAGRQRNRMREGS